MLLRSAVHTLFSKTKRLNVFLLFWGLDLKVLIWRNYVEV